MGEKNLSRKIFFWTLVFIFLISAPSIILYTFGYRFSFERGIFIYSGSITIESNPRELDIFLNGKKVKTGLINRLNNSYIINGIYPGEYVLKLEATGYKSWEKKINVTSGVSTEFWNVVLPKENYEKKNLTIKNPNRFFLVPTKKLGAYTELNDENFSVGIFDTEKMSGKIIYSSQDFTLTDNKQENIEWSPQAHKIIVPIQKKNDDKKDYAVIGIEESSPIYLSTLTLSSDFKSVRWDPEKKDYLFYLSDSKIFKLDLNNQEKKIILASDVSSYDLTRNRIFYFNKKNGIIYASDLDGEKPPEQITFSAPENFMENKDYKLVIYDEKRISLLDSDRNLFVCNFGEKSNYFKKIGINIEGIQFSDDGKKLLFWDEREIFVHFLRAWDTQPARDEGDLISIVRYSQKINNIQWANDYQHVLYSFDGKIKITELDNRGQRNTADIINYFGNHTYFVEDFANSRLFFTEQAENGSINSILFPEKYGLF